MTVLLVATFTSLATAADVIELLSGAKVTGEIVLRDDKNVYIKAILSGVTFNRTYALSSVHAITTTDGTRTVINEKGAAPAKGPITKSVSPKVAGTRPGVSTKQQGTRAELDALIEREGRAPPEWFEATPLNYPQTLNLAFDQPAPMSGWNNQKNVTQFLWDIVNPNPNRWKEGVRLMHHLLTMHKDDKDKSERIMLTLAGMYHNLHEDYARSAFWYRAAGVERDPTKSQQFMANSATLAECYWKLGYPAEAVKLMVRTPSTYAQIKLLGDMGETDQAIKQLQHSFTQQPEVAYLAAGDVCHVAGRYREALNYYQKLLDLPVPAKPNNRLVKNRARASANVAAIKAFELFDLSKVADGDYQSASQGYEGPVEVKVSVSGGKITTVAVTNHREKQFYSAISDTPRKIIAKQTVRGIDTTSHATITSEAIVNATAKALAGNK
ncbi:FMN-binding protein [Anatilimnocola aggregata]|uniref:FMN-binding protein n=1 Tax=Anatilimnocola aggregata TaxID=2528021 RepID=UPI00192E43F6|nr:FMN-binding protein [Anatilimnocola aggregata]